MQAATVFGRDLAAAAAVNRLLLARSRGMDGDHTGALLETWM